MDEAQPNTTVIVGAGLAGLAAALVLAARGVAVTLVGPPADKTDTRTTALMDGSVALLREADVWDRVAPEAAPLRRMEIVDATRRLLRAPPASFDAAEIGLDAFAWNVANGTLVAAMEAAASQHPRIRRMVQRMVTVTADETVVTIGLDDGGEVLARLAIAADGQRSPIRDAVGIAVRRWDYPQAALAVNLQHQRDHRETSTEFHTESGPFTLVPLPGRRSSLVWVMRPQEAERLRGLDDDGLAAEVERQSHALLGKLRIDGPRSTWPMAGLAAARLAAGRVALIGEAAHAFPPIGAQGFNLTMRDVDALARCLAGAEDPGAPALLAAYERSRRFDVTSRSVLVDLLNRSLLSGLLPVQMARGLGFQMLSRVGPLRRLAMRQGLAPALPV